MLRLLFLAWSVRPFVSIPPSVGLTNFILLLFCYLSLHRWCLQLALRLAICVDSEQWAASLGLLGFHFHLLLDLRSRTLARIGYLSYQRS